MNVVNIGLAFLVLGFGILLLGLAGQADYEAEQMQVSLYCEMVEAWDRSGGEYGWPAYDGREKCKRGDEE